MDLRGTPKSMVPEKKASPWPGGAVTSKSTLSWNVKRHKPLKPLKDGFKLSSHNVGA